MATTINLVKGEKITLEKSETLYKVGLGWDVNQSTGASFDLDASAIVLNADGKMIDKGLCYFNDKNPMAGLSLSGDNLTGEGDGDDEVISIDLAKLPADANEVIVNVNIYDAQGRGQNFGMVNNATMNLYVGDQTTPANKFDLSEDASTATILKFVRFYKHNGDWKFAAVGEMISGTFNEYIARF